MNPAGQPNQAAQGQAGQRRIFKPDDMDALPISDAEKLRYKNGLRGLWNFLQTSQRGSVQYLEAQKKIQDFSNQLMHKIRAGMVRPPSSAAQGSQQGQQSSPTTTQAGADPNAAASAGSPPASATSQPPQAPASTTSANPPAQAAQPGGAAISPQLQATLRQHLSQMTFNPPQNVVDQGAEAAAAWTKTHRDRYTRALYSLSQTGERVKEFDTAIKQLQQKGPAITPEEQKKLQEMQQSIAKNKEAHGNAKRFMDGFRKEQLAIKEARAQTSGGAQNPAANQPVPAGPSAQQPGTGNSEQQPSNSGADAAKSQQPGRAPGANGQNGQPGQQQQPRPQPAQGAPAAPPQASPVTTAQPTPNASAQVKIEPGTAPQQRAPPPPVNTAIASAAAGGMPSIGTPTQVTRPPIMPNANPASAAPRSLSHTAAVQFANQTRNSQPAGIAGQNPQQGTPQASSGTPASAGVMGTAQPGHAHAHPTQQPQQTLSQKLPIPKHLPEKAAMPPQPVSTNLGGVTPGRPTFTQGGGTPGGVMGQPVLPKIPVVQMEGEGERVLNRKKLDDLVRQVCGGQAEGQEGNTLTPDVEEVRIPTNGNGLSNDLHFITCALHLLTVRFQSILSLADSFVDRLLHAACSNAKQRGSKVLEIRDIQLVLERGYNIRIPGYSSDELRTVRKVQPAQGWITKMSAIQASKVTGSRDL